MVLSPDAIHYECYVWIFEILDKKANKGGPSHTTAKVMFQWVKEKGEYALKRSEGFLVFRDSMRASFHYTRARV